MAPIKFEENIREKLQEREIQPSEGAWKKLEMQLGETPQQKKPTYFWMAIAASFIGMLLVGSWFFFKKDTVTNQLVNEDQIETYQEEIFQEKPNEDIAPILTKEDDAISETEKETSIESLKDETNLVSPKDLKVTPIQKSKSVALSKENPGQEKINHEKSTDQILRERKDAEEAITYQKTDVHKMENEATIAKLEEENFIQQKVDEVLQEVKKIQEKNNTVSMAEVDALLAKAQRDIATKRILNSNHHKVNAQALLMDVETELERGFRDKVFDALGEGFNKVRTAVAERNN